MRRTLIPFRLVLTAVLLYLAHGETGPWTTLVLALLTISNEMVAFVLSRKVSITNAGVEPQFHGDAERRAVLDALRRVSR